MALSLVARSSIESCTTSPRPGCTRLPACTHSHSTLAQHIGTAHAHSNMQDANMNASTEGTTSSRSTAFDSAISLHFSRTFLTQHIQPYLCTPPTEDSTLFFMKHCCASMHYRFKAQINTGVGGVRVAPKALKSSANDSSHQVWR